MYEVLDFLEEWRPYISLEDAALNLVMLDGVSMTEALEIVSESASERAKANDDFPLCTSREAQHRPITARD